MQLDKACLYPLVFYNHTVQIHTCSADVDSYIIDPVLGQPMERLEPKQHGHHGDEPHTEILVKCSKEDERLQNRKPGLLNQVLGREAERERGREGERKGERERGRERGREGERERGREGERERGREGERERGR